MVRYSLFVLKVPLNTSQPTNRLILMKLGTHYLCANMQKKTMEQIVEILISKFLAII